MIYFLQRADNLVKIGTTTNFYKRLSALEKQHGKLKPLAWREGDRSLEQKIHKQFSEYRVVHEWFYLSDALLEYMKLDAVLGAPRPPRTNLSVNQLYQLVQERDDYIKRRNERIDNLEQSRVADIIRLSICDVQIKGLQKEIRQHEAKSNAQEIEIARLRKMLSKNNVTY